MWVETAIMNITDDEQIVDIGDHEVMSVHIDLIATVFQEVEDAVTVHMEEGDVVTVHIIIETAV